MNDEAWVEEGEAGCRLLLPLPPAGIVLPGFDHVAGLLAPSTATTHDVALAHRAGVTLLVADDTGATAIGKAAAIGADGVVLGTDADPAAARRRLGPDALIGVRCGMSRHAAMVAGEDGADYVLFGEEDGTDDPEVLADLASWWRALFVLPVAVCGPLDARAQSVLMEAGADFLVPPSRMWDDPQAAMDFLDSIAALLARK